MLLDIFVLVWIMIGKFLLIFLVWKFISAFCSDCADLSVSILEAKDLVGPDDDNQTLLDTYVRVYLLPDKTTNLQTRVSYLRGPLSSEIMQRKVLSGLLGNFGKLGRHESSCSCEVSLF